MAEFINFRKSKKKKIEDNIKEILEINHSHDANLLEKGLVFMYDAHEGQTRLNRKKPYTDHTTAVGKYLAAEFSTKIVVPGYLHDVPEKTDITVEIIREEFGDEIADIVEYMVPIIEENNVEHNQRIIKGEIAIPVRLADNLDNFDDDVFSYKKQMRRLIESRDSLIKPLRETEYGKCKLFGKLEDKVYSRLEELGKARDRRYFIGKVAAGLTLLIGGKNK